MENWRTFATHLRNTLLAGLVILIPLVITIWVLNLAYHFIAGVSAPLLLALHIPVIPGLPFLITLLMLLGVGFMATNVWGRLILATGDRLILKLPLVGGIYAGIRQVIDSIKNLNKTGRDKRVVYVPYPAEGSYILAFATGEFHDPALGVDMTWVLLPTAPNPMTALIVAIETTRLINSELTLEEATKLIVSGGVMIPARFEASGAQNGAVV